MEGWIIVGIYILVAVLGFVKRDKGDKNLRATEVSLCLTCVNSVVTRGTCNEEWVACNFGGAMRAVKFTVSSCSGFCGVAASTKLVTIEGFVREEREVYAEVAIS
jgi:hypothetical protein